MRKFWLLFAFLALAGIGPREQNLIISSGAANVDSLIIAAGPTVFLDPDSQTEIEPAVHYACEDNAASTVVIDKSGNQNGASTRNTSVFSTASGKIARGFDFYNGGTDDGIDTSISCNIGNTDFSLCVWVQPDGAGESSAGNLFNCNSRGLFLCGAGTNICFSAGTTLVSNGTITENGSTWSHICLTHAAGGAGVLYINGVIDKAAATGTSMASANFIVGNNSATDRAFDGRIDDVRIYTDRVLSAGEVARIYNSGTGHQNQATSNYLGAIVLDGSARVGAWQSRVNGWEFTQTNDALKPTLTTIGGHRGIAFAGASNTALVSSMTLDDMYNASAKTTFVVGNFSAVTSKLVMRDSAPTYKMEFSATNYIRQYNDDGAGDFANAGTYTTGTTAVFEAIHDTNLTTYLNGVAGNPVASGATASLTGTMQIGFNAITATGAYGKIVTDDSTWSTATRKQIRDGLKAYYGINN